MTYCAIFDLDETLIKQKSMLAVLSVYFHRRAACKLLGKFYFALFKNRLRNFAHCNKAREDLNRYYYKQLKGIELKKIQEASCDWFAKNIDALFNPIVLTELEHHRKQGATIILVTGSFKEAFDPITKYLNIQHVICTNLVKKSFRYTGEIAGPTMIGIGKAQALRAYLQENQINLANSYAYADHESDIPLLSSVDHPIVVGSNPVLLQHANKFKWSIISMGGE